MIVGYFDGWGRPYFEVRLVIPRLQINKDVVFLMDTGASNTCLHSKDSQLVGIPQSLLRNPAQSRGVGGRSLYYQEPAILSFRDGSQRRLYGVNLLIAEPNANDDELPSLLERNVVNHWFMEYDPANGRLSSTVRHADYTLDAAGG